MAIHPVIRHMLLCDDVETNPDNPRQVNIIGLLTNINSVEEPFYPLYYRGLCVYVALTEGRGRGHGFIQCSHDDTERTIFASHLQEIRFPRDPLKVVQVLFRIRDCKFPFAGRYSFRFWYNELVLAERTLLLR